ncbi:MAG: spore cortex biosynthesis protein YabQ [Desulfotomaculaceae bacterium]|nr:spore cortex biosynthesis protein YabQ [Desulfotomaculaceae bacterium]
MLINQAGAFTSTIVIGMSAGLLFDYYRAVRAACKLRRVGTFVGDVVYWLVTTAMVFIMLLWGTWGEVRLYVLIGIGLGALLYFQLFSRAAYRIFRLKFHILHRIWVLLLWSLNWLWLVVTYPVRLLLLGLSYPYLLLRRIVNKMSRGFKTAWYRLVGRRVERVLAGLRSRAARLVFWKRKKDD